MACHDVGMNAPAATAAPTGRPPLLRPRSGRIVAGVCAGTARHLGLSVKLVRLVFVGLGLLLGAGVLLYLWLALLVPVGEGTKVREARLARLAPALRQRGPGRRAGNIALAIVLLVIAASLWGMRSGIDLSTGWILPVIVVLCGAGLAWSQLDAIENQADDEEPATTRTAVLVRVGGGVALAVVGVVMLVGQGQGAGQVARGVIAGIAVLAGAALVLAPWWLRLWRELIAERAARARESERADIAAHLHDSVLQTLSLIRARSSDPATVQRLARAQERQLRDWLYRDRPEPGDSIADEMRQIAAEVEDLHGVPIDVVTAGDRPPDAGTAPLGAATREALVNAVVHGTGPVSLYVEVEPGAAEVFVRDRGKGFDLDAVPADRHGVRDSIIDRMRRHGGTADLRSSEDRGTEVRLRMPANGAATGGNTR